MFSKVHARALAAASAGALAIGLCGTAVASAVVHSTAGSGHTAVRSCVLGPNGSISHVIYIQFDNVHYTRDNPNVPSDLQQMPNLLKFITGQGTLISHEHTPLIAHTADDSVTSETGLYGARHGDPIANEYDYYKPDGTSDQAGSFAYWTDPIVDYSDFNATTNPAGTPVGDKTPTMVGPNGKMAPAPWVSYTRAGCNFGTVAAANTELENTLPDVADVFGKKSPEAKEAANQTNAGQARATADFMGLAVHCAKGSSVCQGSGSVADRLPDEHGGYLGYRAVFGSKFLQRRIHPSGPVTSLSGKVIKNSFGQIGFPGYDGMTGPNGLAYTLDMQLHGVPVTYTYLSDVHDSWNGSGPFGPGEAGYEKQLRIENAAFGKFFTALAAHGITKANTLFVISADEGDHFVGGAPTPSKCNGVKVTCSYSTIGEVNAYLPGVLAAKGITTPLDIEPDAAPSLYVHGRPARGTAAVRALEQTLAGLTGNDLVTGNTTAKLTNYLADPVELKILHMITGDPKRTPTVVDFGNPEFWNENDPTVCGTGVNFCLQPGGDAWNHGTVGSQINTTWAGYVGPGVAHRGVDGSVWSDHTNIQPTIMSLLRLHDDYTPDGRVLAEIFTPSALPAAMKVDHADLIRLGQIYTQLEAPVGEFGLDTLKASTRALASVSVHDSRYQTLEKRLAHLGARRDGVAGKIRTLLDEAAFGGKPINPGMAKTLIAEGEAVLAAAAVVAA